MSSSVEICAEHGREAWDCDGCTELERARALRRMRASSRGELVRATVAARRIGVCAATVRRWVRRGELAGSEVCGRVYVSRSSLEELLERTRSNSSSTSS